ncbi:MAG: hypothetical protein A3F04_01265 [Candidatus Chisholmbacteria bacterium RIFCSPHIGHO2_12_FULL_49_9]|uniref:LmbE family protein n=1 Tax=Candidatus Chisholmbacteria bacterium RIFCSPHIGHO2_01_FULL_52_32 TaxID=1797591 RepID=A0A1G1VT97_9BACT|nr:MAG: hypothetical protein A2786_03955 [Candidatus Chisholmbacteria bacterium RIFCSPHIGHO2_01_FULL_52_32]OGY20004.1 MAG: hypothetical protein A2900_02790 [Candidatus Chisholmbacteria bacterium RIFCSPLOWO2_01_FULL_50_28]OGY21212.1 MAG: hypothetical protein A3F04_01265 [Candidatus Chisholmbacteria bacterium RIFCSPHIGHO2_12_FULL_49_9]
MNQKKVLAIGAHYDDMEQFCGGTLLLLRKQGYDILIAVLTAGECGTNELSAKEIVKIRQKEAKLGAKKIGAKVTCLNIRDGCVSYDLETTKKIVKLMREYQPQIIFTHPTVDYMTDHAHTGQLVLWAVPEATHPNFPVETNAPALEKQPWVYHTDPQGLIGLDGQIVRVNTIVDISEVVETKLSAFASHKSQIGFLKVESSGRTIDSVEKTRRWAITRGQQARVEYGEGFMQQLLEQYPRKNILSEALKDRVFTL